jgi:hypothetical protein
MRFAPFILGICRGAAAEEGSTHRILVWFSHFLKPAETQAGSAGGRDERIIANIVYPHKSLTWFGFFA